jgi:hypothetical protein
MRTLKLLPLSMLMTGLDILQSPLLAQSQTDYEEYIIMEDINEQKINQQNIGSGSSTNINCGTNAVGTNLPQPITTCPSIPGETPNPGIAVRPVVAQRSAEAQVILPGTISGEAECNPDEVVTGGGYELTETTSSGGEGGGQVGFRTFKEFAVDNSWHIEISGSTARTVIVYAECLKLVPS